MAEGYEKIIKICGLNVKEVKSQIKDLIKESGAIIAMDDSTPGEVHINVSVAETADSSAKKLGKGVVKELKNRFGSNIYSTDAEISLEKSIVDLLVTNKLSVSTVESLTGGMLASRIVDVPGASDVFKEGFVTYSNKAKKLRVGVKKSTLLKYGAVSEQTAKEMAKGCAGFTKTDVSISTTGIAGPDGGTADKPVGLVYIGCTVCNKTKVNKYIFEGDRMQIREQATAAALSLLRLCVLEYYSEKIF